MSMQETEEKTTDVFYRFRKRDILKENGLRRNGKGRIRMKRAYFNCILLDGTEQMEPVAHKMVLADGEKITAIVEDTAPCEGYEKVDLKGGYLMPGLINLHVHLAGNGKPSAKPRDNAALVRRILSNGLTRAVAYRLVCSYAKLELLGGVTTIRTVGGLADFDTRCRDDAAKGTILAPRILAASEGIYLETKRYVPKLIAAIIIALGHEHAGLFCNDDALAAKVEAAGRATGELV